MTVTSITAGGRTTRYTGGCLFRFIYHGLRRLVLLTFRRSYTEKVDRPKRSISWNAPSTTSKNCQSWLPEIVRTTAEKLNSLVIHCGTRIAIGITAPPHTIQRADLSGAQMVRYIRYATSTSRDAR